MSRSFSLRLLCLLLCDYYFLESEAFFWKLKGSELDCSVTCGLNRAVSGPAIGSSTFLPYVCAVNGSTFGNDFSTGVQVGTAFYVSDVLSCWVYSGNPGGPSSTSHSSYSCLCSESGDSIGNVTGSTAESCKTSCSKADTLNSPLTACQKPAIEPICYATEDDVFGYQNASDGATDQSCLTVSLPASTSPQTPPASRTAAFSCLCSTENATNSAQLASNCSTNSTMEVSLTTANLPPAVSPAPVSIPTPAKRTSSPGGIIGGVIGGLLGATLLAALGYLIWRRRRRDQQSLGLGIMKPAVQKSIDNPFKRPEAQFSLMTDTSTATSGGTLPFDQAIAMHKAEKRTNSQEVSTLSSPTETRSSGGTGSTGGGVLPYMYSANFADVQDKFGTRVANLPLPGSHKGTSSNSVSDGILSLTLKESSDQAILDTTTDSDLSSLEDTWKIEPKDLQCCMSGGQPMILGQGGFGSVYLGILHRNEVAIKVINSHNQKQQDRFLREIRVLRACHNTHIVQFMGACVREQQTFMVMQYMSGGDLLTRLSADHEGEFGWYSRGGQIALDIAKGLIYLHSKQIAHLDLKSPNVMLTANHEAKIGDVGLGKLVANPNAIATQQGSYLWASPEQLTGENCSTASDIFSFGTVLWEICTHELPINRATRALEIPDEAPESIADLIRHCHQPFQNKRPNAVEVHDVLLKALKTAKL